MSGIHIRIQALIPRSVPRSVQPLTQTPGRGSQSAVGNEAARCREPFKLFTDVKEFKIFDVLVAKVAPAFKKNFTD